MVNGDISHILFTAFVQRISSVMNFKINNLTSDKVLNILIYGSLRASMISEKLKEWP